ncbi:MAG: fibrillarin-like rRNA/tRNA 2'-O-methyltransferase [Promethearchaeota archaeon]|nr:MAG: fibrillarin-like rRNA/tRNA 2'-O-methyltransferase [Candidatus Lokiarchaeota archaeon]
MNTLDLRPYSSFPNVYCTGSGNHMKLYTLNRTPGRKVYGENLISLNGKEYREWDPFRSKLAALLLLKPDLGWFLKSQSCLYLGASSGTTISHLSDMLSEGIIFGVEIAERSIRQLVHSASDRDNLITILGDANYPENYAKSIFKEVDIIYQDVAQPNQAEIAIKNSDYYLSPEGRLIFAIKSQSIDSIEKSEKVYEEEKRHLTSSGYDIINSVNINKFAANHIILIAQRKV